MSEAATSHDVLEGVFAVDEGDDVHLAVHDYEWANPYEVTDVDHVDWEGATGEVWATREVLVEGGYSSTFQVTAIEGDADLELRKYPGGQKRGDLEQFKPVDDQDDEAESGTSTEDTPTSESDSESEAETDILEEGAADDVPGPSTEYLETVNEVLDGDDVQEEIAAEEIAVVGVDGEGEDAGDEIECEGCGQTFESQQALQGHGPNSCEGGDDEIKLPDGVTEDDVDELTSGGIEIGDLAEELDIHRNRARTIAHQLGFYSRVREVWRDRERASIDPRLGGVLVVALGLVTAGLVAVGVTVP